MDSWRSEIKVYYYIGLAILGFGFLLDILANNVLQAHHACGHRRLSANGLSDIFLYIF